MIGEKCDKGDEDRSRKATKQEKQQEKLWIFETFLKQCHNSDPCHVMEKIMQKKNNEKVMLQLHARVSGD